MACDSIKNHAPTVLFGTAAASGSGALAAVVYGGSTATGALCGAIAFPIGYLLYKGSLYLGDKWIPKVFPTCSPDTQKTLNTIIAVAIALFGSLAAAAAITTRIGFPVSVQSAFGIGLSMLSVASLLFMISQMIKRAENPVLIFPNNSPPPPPPAPVPYRAPAHPVQHPPGFRPFSGVGNRLGGN